MVQLLIERHKAFSVLRLCEKNIFCKFINFNITCTEYWNYALEPGGVSSFKLENNIL